MLVTFEKDGCYHRNILSSIKKMNLLFLLHLVLFNHWKSLPTLYHSQFLKLIKQNVCAVNLFLDLKVTVT